MKIAFIGPKQYSESMRLIGAETFEVNSEREALDLIKNLQNDDYKIIFASNDILEKDIEGVVVLPGIKKKEESVFLDRITNKVLGKNIKI